MCGVLYLYERVRDVRAAVRERRVHHAVCRRGRRAARTVADDGCRGSEGRLRYQCLLVVSAYNEHYTLMTSPLVYCTC